MTEPWTPGPWAVDTIHENGFYLQDAQGYELHDGRTEANRRLIAAAPEMAELLEGWVRRYPADLHDESEGTMELLSRIRSEA